MADQKISELTALTGANVADDDAIAIVDTSATETKKIVFSELKNALDTATDFVRITGDTMTGDLTVPNVVVSGNVDGRDVSADGTKLDGIEASADVTDATNVAAAGALMDSEVTNLAQVKAFDSSDYATAAQGSTADAALPKAGGTMTGNLAVSAASPNIDVTDTGTSHASQDFLTNSSAARATIGVESSAGGGLFVGSSAYAAVFGTASAGKTEFATNNNVRMTISAAGSIGINNSAPVETLHIKGTNPRVYLEGDTNSYYPSIRVDGFHGGISLGTYWGGNISGTNGITFLTGSSATDAGTQRMKLDSSGHLIIPDGVTLGTSAGVYAAANTISDYEEGSWSAASGYGTLTGVTATYTKIGNSVFIRLDCTMPSTSSSGHMAISGLPFTTAQDGSAQIGFTQGGNYHPAILIQGTTCYFYNGSGAAIPASTYSGAIVRFTGQYNTTA